MLTSRKTSFDLTSTRTITLTGLLFIMGTVFGFLGISNTPFSGLTAKLIGIGLFCVAFVLYSMIWARVFERLSPAKTLLVIALSVCFSTIIRAFTYIDIHGSIVGGIALSVILCCSLFQASRCQQLSQETWAIDFNRELPNQPFKDVFFGTTREPLLIAFAVSFGVGLTWGDKSALDYNSTFSLAAIGLVAACAIAFALSRNRMPYLFFILYRIAFPLAALLLLASLLLAAPDLPNTIQQALQFLYYMAMTFYEIAVVASIVAVAHLHGFSSARAISAKICIYGLGILLGKAVLAFFGGEIVNLALGAMLIGYVAVSFISLAAYQISTPEKPASSRHDVIIEKSQDDFGFTTRELDILSELLQGRTYEGIARALFISSSTVKTHVKHIYAKASVCTRDELIDLLLHRYR